MFTAMSLVLVQCVACSRCSKTVCQTTVCWNRALSGLHPTGREHLPCARHCSSVQGGQRRQTALAVMLPDREVSDLPQNPQGQEVAAHFIDGIAKARYVRTSTLAIFYLEVDPTM